MRLRYFSQLLLVAALYFLSSRFAFQVSSVLGSNVAAIWPGAGFALAAFLLGGVRLWPGIWLGALLAEASTGISLGSACVSSLADLLEPLLGLILLTRLLPFECKFERFIDIMYLALAAALGSIPSAFIGANGLYQAGVIEAANTPFTIILWWLASVLGTLLVVPPILAWKKWPARLFLWSGTVEALSLLAGILLLGFIGFGVRETGVITDLLSYAFFPLLFGAAIRFGIWGAATANLLVSLIAITGAIQRIPPFEWSQTGQNILFLQGFLIILIVADLALAAASSESKQAEERHQQLEALKQADLLKDQFMSIVSHELRTPLNFITGYGSILQDEIAGSLTQQQHEYLQKMLGGADQLELLIEDLLDISRIQSGNFKINPSPFSLPSLMQKILADVTPLTTFKKQRLIPETAPELPHINADEQRIAQVYYNLIQNAIKFSPEGSTIWIRAKIESNHFRGEVTDNGPGISTEDQQHLFQRFSRLPSEERGSGLGLFIARSIIESHEGKIGVHSTLGQGSTFWFTLPLTPA